MSDLSASVADTAKSSTDAIDLESKHETAPRRGIVPDASGADMPQTTPQFEEGGIRAWLVVVGCWCVSFTSLGYVNSFGIYETYYLQTFMSSYSPSDVAWIGSVQVSAQFSAALFSGPLTDRYGAMVIIWPSSIVLVIAMMLTSICTEFYEFLLCQGVLLGISTGFIVTPALSVIGHFFSKKRVVAMALASTGSPIGGIIYPVIMTNLLHEKSIGFPWGQRICAFLSLFLLVIAAIAIRPKNIRRKGSFILLEAFMKPTYSLQVIALFLVVLGLWTPYFYVASFGLANGMTPSLASYLFAVINGGSFVGRVLGGVFAHHLGQFNAITLACYASAILLFCWLKIVSPAGLVIFSFLYGGTSGTIIALMMSTITHTADHPSKIGTYIGMSVFLIGFAGLFGAPITGALISGHNGYSDGIIFSGSVIMAGAVCVTCARYFHAKDKLIA